MLGQWWEYNYDGICMEHETWDVIKRGASWKLPWKLPDFFAFTLGKSETWMMFQQTPYRLRIDVGLLWKCSITRGTFSQEAHTDFLGRCFPVDHPCGGKVEIHYSNQTKKVLLEEGLMLLIFIATKKKVYINIIQPITLRIRCCFLKNWDQETKDQRKNMTKTSGLSYQDVDQRNEPSVWGIETQCACSSQHYAPHHGHWEPDQNACFWTLKKKIVKVLGGIIWSSSPVSFWWGKRTKWKRK